MKMPGFVYGTAWKEDTTTALTAKAVSAGFKGIDTANQPKHYQEHLVGDALVELEKQGITRNSLFLQTKFTPANGQDHRIPYDPQTSYTDQVNQSFESSLAHLHTDYLDSYLLHGPYSMSVLLKADWEVWNTMEELYRLGKAKMIGISNVNANQLWELIDKSKIKPMVVQNRCFAVHGWDEEVRKLCRANDIIYQGFSLLTANWYALKDKGVLSMSQRLGKTPAQLIFRFAMQVGMVPLTGTTDEEHMKEDLKAFDFKMEADDVEYIERIGLR